MWSAVVVCTDGRGGGGGGSCCCFSPAGFVMSQHYVKQRHHVNCGCESICNLVCPQSWIMWAPPEHSPASTILQGEELYLRLLLCFLKFFLFEVDYLDGLSITSLQPQTSLPVRERLSAAQIKQWAEISVVWREDFLYPVRVDSGFKLEDSLLL